MTSPAITIPVDFKPAEAAPLPRLTVTEQEAIEMLSLNRDNRSKRAQKDAFKIFRDKHKIKPLTGFVFSLKQLEYHASGECRCRS